MRCEAVAVRGVTLIELLIVCVILGLTVSLVAPLSFNQIEKWRAKQEWLYAEQEMFSLMKRAYLLARPINVEFSDQTMVVTMGDRIFSDRRFKFVSFRARQIVTVSSNGFAEPSEIEGYVGSEPVKLSLNQWLR